MVSHTIARILQFVAIMRKTDEATLWKVMKGAPVEAVSVIGIAVVIAALSFLMLTFVAGA